MMKLHLCFSFLSLGLASALGLLACGADISPPDTTPTPPMPPAPPVVTPPSTTAGPANAFNHDGILGDVGDLFADGREVPADVGQYMHACGKLQYASLGRILASRGVNITNMAMFSAGQLYQSGNLVIGVANYPARVPEANRNTTGGIVRLYDILIAAAEELLPTGTTDLLSTSQACMGNTFFNADGTCNPAGFGCFMGVPPTAAQIDLCNTMVADTFDPNILDRKRLAVAAMASPIFLCD